MNRIHEEIKPEIVIVPLSQEAAGNSTGTYIDGAGADAIDFVISVGALAAGKKVTIEVQNADDTSAANNAQIGDDIVVTAPTGGWTSQEIVVSVAITATRKRFYSVKVTNDAAAAVLLSAISLKRGTYLPMTSTDVYKV